MRIALVTDYYPPTLGGVQTAVVSLKNALADAGHEVTVFCPLATPSLEPDVVGLPISSRFRPDGYPFAWSPRRVATVLHDEFAGRGIEVVHTHSEMFAALAGIRSAHRLRLPVVHTMHGRIDVYTANVLPAPAITMPLLAMLHSRQVSHRGLRVERGSDYTATAGSRRMWRLMLAQARASDGVIVPSAHFADKLAAQGVGTPITVLSNGLEHRILEDVGEPTPRSLTADDLLRVIWVGRLSPEKRPAAFFDAARSFGPRVSVDVYGDGVARRSVERLAAPVTVHGSVPQSEILGAMRQAHVLVSSSLGFDNQPMVMLEAIATGLPVIYCDPDLAEVVPAGGGFLTPTPDSAGIAAAVAAVRADEGAITAASTAMIAARERVVQQVEPTVRVYEAALAAARMRRR